MKNLLYILVAVLLGGCLHNTKIQTGDLVLIYLKLTNKAGKTIDETGHTNQAMPLLVKVGNHEVFEPIDNALLGMKLNEKQQIVLLPNSAYLKQGVFYINKNHDNTYVVNSTDTLFAYIKVLKIN